MEKELSLEGAPNVTEMVGLQARLLIPNALDPSYTVPPDEDTLQQIVREKLDPHAVALIDNRSAQLREQYWEKNISPGMLL